MPLIWTYAVGSEVFALNTFFVALIVRMSLWLAEMNSSISFETRLNACAAVSALGLGNQHTLILLVIPMFCWLFLAFRNRLQRVRILFVAAAFFFVPFVLIYGFLLASAVWNPSASSWGDLSTMRGLLRHMLRSDYGTFQLYSGDDSAATSFTSRTLSCLQETFVNQLHWTSTLALSCGLLLVFMRGVRFDKAASQTTVEPSDPTHSVPMLLVASWLFYIVVFHKLANLPLTNPLFIAIYSRFWMQPAAVIFPVLFAGVDAVFSQFSNQVQSILGKGVTAHKSTHAFFAILAALLAARQRHVWTTVDNTNNTYIRDYGVALLATLPTNATLVTAFDFQWTSVKYLKECENYAPTITILNAPMMTFDWFASKQKLLPTVSFPGQKLARYGTAAHLSGGFSVGEFMAMNTAAMSRESAKQLANKIRQTFAAYSQAPKTISLAESTESGGGLYHAGTIHFDAPQEYSKLYEWVPHGLVYKAVKRPAGLNYSHYKNMRAALELVQELYSPPSTTLPTDPSTWEFATRVDYTRMLAEHGTVALDIALGHDDNRIVHTDALLWALKTLEQSVHLELNTGKNASSRSWKNLGLGYFRLAKNKVNLDIHNAEERPLLPHLSRARNLELGWSEWRSEASIRVLSAWQEFVQCPDAVADQAFQSISGVVQVLSKASGK